MELRPLFRIIYSFICSVLQWRIILADTTEATTRRVGSVAERQYNHHKINLDDSKHNEEFFTFVTRPDIDAPRWDIDVLQEDAVSPEYWFSAPYSDVHQLQSDGPWNGPAIYDGAGELIWSGAPIFDGWSTFDFRVIDIQGRPMLSVISRHKLTATVFDETYQVHKTIGMKDDTKELRENAVALNMHEFTTVERGAKALYMTRQLKKTSREIPKPVGMDSECYVIFDMIKELDTQTWETTNEWSLEGHVGLHESYAVKDPHNKCTKEAPWDYFHANSIDTFPNGDYLVSGRRTYAIYRVSRDSGSIVWRLGGRKSDFQMSFNFSGQHSAKILNTNDTNTTISLLDNAFFPNGDPQHSNDMSRGLLFQLDTTTMTAITLSEYPHPYETCTIGRGNMQMLPNGNAWLCWATNPLQSEHALDGSLIMKANFKTNIASYRSFKYPWIGRPRYPPDVHAAIARKDGQWYTIVHMSWNGATEIHNWRIYHTTKDGRERSLIATIPKQGFETSTWTEGYASHVFVEALDRNGNVLGRSTTFASLPPRSSAGSAEGSYLTAAAHDSRVTLIFGIFLGILAGLLAWGIRKWMWPLQKMGRFAWWRQNTQVYDALPEEHEEERMELRGLHKDLEDDISDSQSQSSP